ncbi:TPA: DUF924 family protein [Pseudomonas aeruginosa]|uniref:DUF924 family protein n=1 Tax=Pseudomonas aeruginosa TaxID=287 RepID=UPI0004F2FC6F|nr:DUF924 family protein [Pseudomonas aeruginosa]AYW61601.1 DUF924 family protein [Pseudomonas aeruginosa]EIU3607766.1 DUF924 family protein [Pseudomonas aeruginosa]EIU3815339.1 DUF924 family protein [Pseudomonas aeruginosa]EIU3821695.1 DUF924 family protein [Pseudomonas aeruginosa]ELT9666223.1 DUF924 family protein [Pseudomonas aeruginosa]
MNPAGIELIDFWRRAGDQGLWFAKQASFDRAFRRRFLNLHLAVVDRHHDDWIETPLGALGLLLLTDQFPRNAFRGSARLYATDPIARHFALQALEAGHMPHVDAPLRVFFCLPFAHSEDLADQALSIRLNKQLGQPWLAHAEGHCDIIRRFGRFPHRNAILGRVSTQEEERFLQEGGFAG